MVNAFGYYASAKGMVLVPDLSGLSSAASISALESAGLDYFLGADVTTSNQALDNLVAQQDPASGTLVDYDTVVSFSLYNFVPVGPFFPYFPDFPPSLPIPTFQLNSTGNASGGNRFVNVYLTNYDTYDALGGVTFSPTWTSFESTYPEYIRDVPPNTDVTIEVTVSKSGYSNATGSITVNSGEYTGSTITTWYAAGCCSTSGRVTAASSSSSVAAVDALESACPTGVVTGILINEGVFGTDNYPDTSCSPTPSPSPTCVPTWTFGNYYDFEECRNGQYYVESGYYEVSTNCGYQTRDVVTYSDTLGPC